MTLDMPRAPVLRFEPAGAETWSDPWPMYRALRDHDPVHHVVPEPNPTHDYYVLSRHADVWAAARDHVTFSSAQGLTVTYGELERIGLADNPPMVALTELLARCPDFTVDEAGIVWADGSYVRRPASVPVRL